MRFRRGKSQHPLHFPDLQQKEWPDRRRQVGLCLFVLHRRHRHHRLTGIDRRRRRPDRRRGTKRRSMDTGVHLRRRQAAVRRRAISGAPVRRRERLTPWRRRTRHQKHLDGMNIRRRPLATQRRDTRRRVGPGPAIGDRRQDTRRQDLRRQDLRRREQISHRNPRRRGCNRRRHNLQLCHRQ
ncbi:hypothetical protein NDU88_007883 [Pleurodeles waltl]|uniref:Uncharacterized protein n=1 Tax=Pleurodeles waltl TaxID=8319 RepID=A0AAV7U2U7_PLEWA|nr:hypothetical protein NDU88_007883 [Pleurodeles waltl]